MKYTKNLVAALGLTLALAHVSAPAFADNDEKTLKLIADGCLEAAKVAAEKAAEDLVNVMAAQGGNISAQLAVTIQESRAGFIMLHSATCEADAIRKFKVQTQYPLH